jgi:hypothetical protein
MSSFIPPNGDATVPMPLSALKSAENLLILPPTKGGLATHLGDVGLESPALAASFHW